MEAKSAEPETAPIALPGDSEELPSPRTASAPRSLIMSLQTGPLAADEPQAAQDFPVDEDERCHQRCR